jgi:hypothetical protein
MKTHIMSNMQLHVAELENRFKASEVVGNAHTSSNQNATRVEYFTDDEEKLAEEKQWVRVKSKIKKRNMDTSPIPHQQKRGDSEPSQQKDK